MIISPKTEKKKKQALKCNCQQSSSMQMSKESLSERCANTEVFGQTIMTEVPTFKGRDW